MIVVADTTPLRYLILIGEVRLLPLLYVDVLIPPAVLQELRQPATPEIVRGQIEELLEELPNWLRVLAPIGSTAALPAALGPGEREAIVLAEEQKADALLLDDWTARQEASRRSLLVLGTLRILTSASEKGLLDLPSAIGRLRQTNFRASNQLLQAVLDEHAKRKGL